MECEFCKLILESKGSLNQHKKTSKKCLKIQGKTSDIHNCQHCNKKFTTIGILKEHYKSCYELKKIKEQ